MRNRVEVSEELKKYRPLTTWQIIALAWREVGPWVSTSVATIAASILIVTVMNLPNLGISRVAVAWAGFVEPLLLGVFAFEAVRGFRKKRNLYQAVETFFSRNVDGFGIIYGCDKSGSTQVVGPCPSSLIEGEVRKLDTKKGFLYFVLSFGKKPRGYVFAGSATTISSYWFSDLATPFAWEIVPRSLTMQDATVSFVSPDGSVEVACALCEAVIFIDNFPYMGTEKDASAGTVLRRLAVMVENSKNGLACSERNFQQAMEALDEVYKALERSKRFIKSKEAQAIREVVQGAFARLVPYSDGRRRAMEDSCSSHRPAV